MNAGSIALEALRLRETWGVIGSALSAGLETLATGRNDDERGRLTAAFREGPA